MTSNDFRNFSMYYPRLAEKAVSCTHSILGMTVKLSNGECYLYDDREQRVRRLPDDSANLSTDEFKRDFGERLYKIMQRKFITQEELSEKTGISQPTLSNYVRGSNIPSFYAVDKIAKALECSVDDLRYTD